MISHVFTIMEMILINPAFVVVVKSNKNATTLGKKQKKKQKR